MFAKELNMLNTRSVSYLEQDFGCYFYSHKQLKKKACKCSFFPLTATVANTKETQNLLLPDTHSCRKILHLKT